MNRSTVEDFYPLSPMQQGMLFHSLYAPDVGMYVEQLSCTFRGELDVAALERAWQFAMDRHATLRTAFLAGDLKEPVQVVYRPVPAPLRHVDWRDRPAGERTTSLFSLLEAERRAGFRLSEPPLMRVLLVRTEQEAYTWVWTYHHLLLDGWSVPLVLNDVMAAYEAFRRGRHPELAPVRPYRDYITWLRRQDMARAEAFWRQYLQDFTIPTPMAIEQVPLSRRRVRQRPEPVSIQLPPATTAALNAIAAANEATLGSVLQAAWAVLLSRYNGQDEVLFGVTVSGRPPELEGCETIAGLFTNTLPVRVRIDRSETVGHLARRLEAGMAELQKFQYSPLGEIQGYSEVPRGTPLFNSIVMFENYPRPAWGGSRAGICVEQVRTSAHMNHTVALAAIPGETLSLELGYDRARLDRDSVQRALQNLGGVLETIAAGAEQRVGTVPVLTRAERSRILGWNQRRLALPRHSCVQELLERQAARTPEAIAVACAAHEAGHYANLTYDALNRRANQLAHYLRRLGVGPECRVGIFLERSPDLIVALCGVLKAGGVYVPMDPRDPAGRLSWIQADSGIRLLITHSRLANLAAGEARPVCLDTDWGQIAWESEDNPDDAATPENLAYVIYTSGSTGKPKGVLIPHRALLNYTLVTSSRQRLDVRDRVLQMSTPAVDMAVEEIYPALLSGARLVLAPPGELLTAEALRALIERDGITVLHLPTAYWHEWVYEITALRQFLPDCLRIVVVGGEKASAERYNMWRQATRGRVRFINLYGPTETTVAATHWDPIPGEDLGGREVPIGMPIENVRVYILDRFGELAPVGVKGDLFIGGVGVGRGYLDRPDLTARCFVPDPFSGEPGTRIYRTGDLARWRADGNVDFLGRVDDQIKIRGFRVEPAEVAAVLAEHPALRESLVMARPGPTGETRLAAYCVAKGTPPPNAELRAWLRSRLPEYMVPTSFVWLASLPVTAHGRVDRSALPAPDSGSNPVRRGREPRNGAERKLAMLMAAVLGLPRVSIDDNFFELGGDSILAIQFVARANRAGFGLRVQHLLEHPTIAEFAALAGGSEGEPAAIESGPFPLAPAQRWFFENHTAGRHHFNTSMLLRMEPGLDLEALRAAIERLMVHHEALRLRFVAAASGWLQEVCTEPVEVPWSYRDLSGLDEAGCARAVESDCAAMQESFDLTYAPLFRVAYFDFGAEAGGRLLVLFHHLIADACSRRIFLEDLGTIYHQLRRGEAAVLPRTTPYRRWIEALARYSGSRELMRERAYWRALESLETPRLPLDHPGGANTYGSAERLTYTLDAAETARLLQVLPATIGLHAPEILLTALVNAMAGWTGGRRLLIDTDAHGREGLPGGLSAAHTMGWLDNIYPLFLDIEGADGLREQVREVARQVHAVPSRGLGYGILRYLSPDPEVAEELGRLPNAEVKFSYLGRLERVEAPGAGSHRLPLRMAEEWPGPEESPRMARLKLLDLVAVVIDGQLEMRWTYSRECHRRGSVEALAQVYIEQLRRIGGLAALVCPAGA